LGGCADLRRSGRGGRRPAHHHDGRRR
jgi:hypothetical protein